MFLNICCCHIPFVYVLVKFMLYLWKRNPKVTPVNYWRYLVLHKLEGNYIRMLCVILNKSWKQHSTKQQLYGHLPPLWKTIQIRQTRPVGHSWRSKDKLISDIFYGLLHMDTLVLADQQELTYTCSVQTQYVVWRTWW